MEVRYQQVLKDVGVAEPIVKVHSVSGGCINRTLRLETENASYFLKENTSEQYNLFQKERLGLDILAEKSAVRVPGIIGQVTTEKFTYLVLEWIEKGHQNENFWTSFGESLAKQHQCSSTHFGLDHNNHIGRLPQSNTNHEKWLDFFINERLLPQIEMASKTHLLDSNLRDRFESLFLKLGELIPDERPALLHGDLWSGNFLCSDDQQPVIFDPAVHFGHRETELAFTHMFGGFDSQLYKSYQESFRLEPGFDDRIELHNLYPLLAHVNLFGSSYLSGVIQTLRRFT